MEQSFNKSAAFEPRRFFDEAAQYKGRTYNTGPVLAGRYAQGAGLRPEMRGSGSIV
jgi:hypothetical protein